MKNGAEVVKEWERRQEAGRYNSYSHSMADLATMIDAISAPAISYVESSATPLADDKWEYREEQARLRAAGFDAYNCDMVDEFPRW